MYNRVLATSTMKYTLQTIDVTVTPWVDDKFILFAHINMVTIIENTMVQPIIIFEVVSTLFTLGTNAAMRAVTCTDNTHAITMLKMLTTSLLQTFFMKYPP